jgi:hypothetical protein
LGALRVEANFLLVCGIRPLAGRAFMRDEDRPGGPCVAMISYGLWRNRFAASPQVVGRTLLLDDTPVEVAGVLPKDFTMPTLTEADILLPLRDDR